MFKQTLQALGGEGEIVYFGISKQILNIRNADKDGGHISFNAAQRLGKSEAVDFHIGEIALGMALPHLKGDIHIGDVGKSVDAMGGKCAGVYYEFLTDFIEEVVEVVFNIIPAHRVEGNFYVRPFID